MPASAVQPAWTNAAVLAFAEGRDPVAAVTESARQILTAAHEAGLQGPPVDVIEVAKLMGIALRPANTVTDALIAPISSDPTLTKTAPLAPLVPGSAKLGISYNPSRPRGRLRFSIAHEIAHAMFPGVDHGTHHRTATGAVPDSDNDEWELELLCNVFAAELLLPDDAVAGLLDVDTDIDFILETRRRWDVSTEALLRRLVAVSSRGLTMLAASRVNDDTDERLRIDYAVGPSSGEIARGETFSLEQSLSAPFAVGQTTRSVISLKGVEHNVQAVGIPPYPGRVLPRILALLEPQWTPSEFPRVRHEARDIIDVGADGPPLLIAHVVANSAHGWSRQGVAASLAQRFPQAASAFRHWTIASPDNLVLGAVHHVQMWAGERPVTIVSMVAQDGHGASKTVRLHYSALSEALAQVALLATSRQAVVHLPRIGAGQAGGRWDLIEEIITEELADRGLDVTIHTLPAAASSRRR
ncbi:MAG: ImmA/IrrE family metallo-endopeptidase [Actinomycetota bacterium]|nr:ImmA/IrrE family metallo-endopeptidase [Actinomycetota bacterium]